MLRTINKKSEGKHIGHACEGHFRGIVQRALRGTKLSLTRQLPFQLHVNPDVVILDQKKRVHTVGIVAFWKDSKSSEKKYYRCRSEYVGVRSAIPRHPHRFVAGPTVVVVLYGAPGGWKAQILRDLQVQCSPCFYLPKTFSTPEAAKLVQMAYSLYKPRWEGNKAKAREYVEGVIANKATLTKPEYKLLKLVQGILSRKLVGKSAAVSNQPTRHYKVRLPANAISTRYRQALGCLSVFPRSEIDAWRTFGSRTLSTPDGRGYALRAQFLGLGRLILRSGMGRTRVQFQPSRPIRHEHGKDSYAPDLVDFISWHDIPIHTLHGILDAHRELTRTPGKVFKGGAFDQCIGNWRDICKEVAARVPPLIKALKRRHVAQVARALANARPVGPEGWHPAAGRARFYPVWALAAATVACIQDNRSLRSRFKARTKSLPLGALADRLARFLVRLPNSADLLQESCRYCRALLSGNLHRVASTKIPSALSQSNPSSLTADFYNTLTTNSSHNPLNAPVREWLAHRFPGLVWRGWPQNRSVAISEALGTKTGRRQWQFIGGKPAKRQAVAAEVKSITGNHWGDKSKEVYDRVQETRNAARSARLKVTCIGVLDGDVGTEDLAELATGIGYDEVYSIKEILGIP